jgi:conjugal transfer pilus assembly protein TraK
MKTYILAFALTLALCSTALAGGVLPDVPTMVQLSNHDINRVVCSGQISDLIFSKDNGLIGRFSGDSAYITFSATDENGKRIYAKQASQMYVVCDGATYSLIAEPVAKEPITVRLAVPESKSISRNIDLFKNMPMEKRALKLIKQGYAGIYPDSYKVTDDKPERIALCSELTVIPKVTVGVEGVGLRLKIFQVTAKQSENLTEKTFLSSKISDSILAVAVENHNLKASERTRVFVVEQKAQSGPPAMAKAIKTFWNGGLR